MAAKVIWLLRVILIEAVILLDTSKNRQPEGCWRDSLVLRTGEAGMAGQPGFLDAEARLQALSAKGDLLERLAAAVEFELFRAELEAACSAPTGARAGARPMTRC